MDDSTKTAYLSWKKQKTKQCYSHIEQKQLFSGPKALGSS